jgi:hypothetical protein
MLVEANKVITLAADVFFVDGTAFLLTVGRLLKFVTAEHVPVRTATSLSKHIKRVLEVYGQAGFRVRTIPMDGEFEKIKPLLPTLECNTTAAKEHVSKAEHYPNSERTDVGVAGHTPVFTCTKKDEG